MIPSPSELGLPARFDPWRPQQEAAFADFLVSPNRVDVGALATGVGKSLLGMGISKHLGARTVVLTSTKGLMDQYLGDFRESGLYDVRGMNNYPCRLLLGDSSCGAGPCLDGDPCPWKRTGCRYFDRVQEAARRDLVITNYAWWFQHHGQGLLGPRDLLVTDEAHTLVEEVAAAVGVEFHRREVDLVSDMKYWDLPMWQEWAEKNWKLGVETLIRGGLSPGERRQLRNLVDRFKRLMSAVDWAWDFHGGSVVKFVKFEPVSPAPFVESYLLQGIPRVLLLSATIRPAMLRDLGIEAYTFHEETSPFPAYKRPIYWVKTGVKLNHDTGVVHQQFHVRMLDNIMATRLDRKGIIHTVSYARAAFIKKHSRFGDYMMIHSSEETRDVVERFKKAEPPAVLVSPSIHTGWDFPYEQADWQIIAKVPFPDTRVGIAAARQARDREYSKRFAATVTVQMAGRIVRNADDAGETFIVDDTWDWFYNSHRQLFPRSFREALNVVTVAPGPMPLDRETAQKIRS